MQFYDIIKEWSIAVFAPLLVIFTIYPHTSRHLRQTDSDNDWNHSLIKMIP